MTGPPYSTSRLQFLDIARGIAVLGMVYMHFVPTERLPSSGIRGLLEQIASSVAHFIEGKSAALFCVLAGMVWAVQVMRTESSRRTLQYVLRRSAVLGLAGCIFHYWIWSTEILVPLAFMMLLAYPFRQAQPRLILFMVVCILAATSLVPHFDLVASEDSKLVETSVNKLSFGWELVRYVLISGNYPLIPWMAFPLLGMWLMRGAKLLDNAGTAFWPAFAITVLAHVYVLSVGTHVEFTNKAPWAMAVTWVPTSIPFMILNGASAMALITGLSKCRTETLSKWFTSFSQLGRASLTHYILHICLVFVPLRRFFPDEDWSILVGVTAFLGYSAIAMPASVWWFKMHSRGPLEGVWTRLSEGCLLASNPASNQ